MESYLMSLKRAVKFLLFREDEPKHRVFDLKPLHLALMMPLPLGACAGGILAGWFYGGALGALAMYLAVCFLVLEIPHCICDR